MSDYILCKGTHDKCLQCMRNDTAAEQQGKQEHFETPPIDIDGNCKHRVFQILYQPKEPSK